MQLSQAIDKLRPEFPQRDCLRRELLPLFVHSNTYFATIPRGICNIIADMVPDLRMSYPAEPFKSTDQLLADFNAKYRGQNRLYDRVKLKQDFPELIDDYGSDILNVKFINGRPQFFMHTIDKYLGTDRETGLTTILINRNFQPNGQIYRISKDLCMCMKELIFNNSLNLMVPWGMFYEHIYLLPCGLCLVRDLGARLAFITDIQNNSRIDVNDAIFAGDILYKSLVDDFGQKIAASITGVDSIDDNTGQRIVISTAGVKSVDILAASKYNVGFLRISM